MDSSASGWYAGQYVQALYRTLCGTAAEVFKGELQGVAFNEVIYGLQESITVLRRRYERPEVKAAVWRRGVAAARGAQGGLAAAGGDGLPG